MRQPTAHAGTGRATPVWAWCALAAVVIGSAAIRARLLDAPLERDEGEYAYIGQLLRDGIPPYAEAYNMKLPGIYAAYAVVLSLFGETIRGVHLGLLAVNAITAILVFLLAREWLEGLGAVAAAAGFALLSLGQAVQGVFAHAEHYVIGFAVAGLWLVVRESTRPGAWRLIGGGLLLGVGVLMKQHGLALAGCGALFAGLAPGRRPLERLVRAAAVALAAAVPYVAMCLLIAAAGTFDRFWFWTVEYASAYTGQLTLSQGLSALSKNSQRILAASPLVWACAGAGLVVVVASRRLRPHAPRLLVLAATSFAATCPSLFFRPHYFVLLLPAAGLLFGCAIEVAAAIGGRRSRVAGLLLGGALGVTALGDALSRQADFLFRLTPLEVTRHTYGSNPFPEAIEIARYLRERTAPGERIAILGSEPQIFFYADRKSASGYIYTYALMERHRFALEMQQEMIAQIEAAAPRYIVVVEVPTSWLREADSATLLFEWFASYRARYRPVGLVQIFSDGTSYQWGDQVQWPPRSTRFLVIFERNA